MDEKKPVLINNIMFSNMNNFLSLNNLKFCDFAESIYPIALEIKDTTDTETDNEIRLRIILTPKELIQHPNLGLSIV